jgi:hypothetical protein
MVLLAAIAAVGCDSATVGTRPALPANGKADGASTLLLGGTSYCPDSAPYDSFDTVSYVRTAGKYQAISFTATEGDQPEIALAAGDASPDASPQVWLEDEAGNVIISSANDNNENLVDLDTPSLARGGLYYVIFANKLDADATFKVRIDCTQGACAVTHSCGVTLPLSQ